MLNITFTDTTSNLYFDLDPDEIGTVEGFEYPSVRGVIEDISGPKSSLFITSKFGRRPLSVIGLKRNQSCNERVDMLGVFRQDGNLRLLEFTTLDGLMLRTEVLINKILYPYNKIKKAFLIDMVAPDWRFYSQIQKSTNSAAMNQTMVNAGNEITQPVFKIYGPFTSATITNLTNSETFTITETIVEDEYIEIDPVDETIMLVDGYGETSVFSSFTGDFISLLPGTNLINFVPYGDDANTKLVTTYRDAYLGV